MSVRAQIESWLAMADLPQSLPRKLDAEGFWSVSMGPLTLTLGIPTHLEQAERPQFFLYMPLLSLEGFTSSVRERFCRRLLEIQLRGGLPVGMAFGMDSEGDLLVLAGRYPVRVMEAALFSHIEQALVGSPCLISAITKRFQQRLSWITDLRLGQMTSDVCKLICGRLRDLARDGNQA